MSESERYHKCAHPDRSQSPRVEEYVQDALRDGLQTLLASRGLYQRIEVNLSEIKRFSKEGSNPAFFVFSTKDLLHEFAIRPWIPISRYIAEDLLATGHTREKIVEASSKLGAGRGRVLDLPFFLPTYQAHCDICDRVTPFSSLCGSLSDGRSTVYPKFLPEGTEQIFVLFYRCDVCLKFTAVSLVKRQGLKLMMCGRSERYVPGVEAVIPKELRGIVEEAISAENEADLFAGFYHLRTFLEHYMKQCLGIPIEVQIKGEELSEQYKGTLDERMNTGFPGLGQIYGELSQFMHARTGKREDFDRILHLIEAHFKAKQLFAEFKPDASTKPAVA